jgi:hypothetical protein
MIWNLSRNLSLSIAAAALLAGCGSKSSSDAAKPAAKAVIRKALNPADELSRNMVSAVAATKPSTLPIQVKFELRDRPQIGAPASLDLAIVPMSASIERVSGKVEGEEGLEIVEGAQIAATDRPTEGTPIRQSVKVLPRQDGIFTVHAVVSVDAGGQTSSETYSIPVIAGNGSGDLPTKSAGPATAAAIPAGAPAGLEGKRTAVPGTAAAQ